MAASQAPVCELCDGTGFVVADPDAPVRRMKHCTCVRARQGKAAEGVPFEFREARLANYRAMPGNRSAIAAAKAFLAGHCLDLFLMGGVGCGKTRLACSVLNDRFAETRDALFVRTPKLLLDLQLMGRDDTERGEERRYLERLCSVGVLVLDDLGVEKPSHWTNTRLYTVYEERGDRGLRTIWTSNLALGDLGEFLGDDRLPSRIALRVGGADPVGYGAIECPDQRVMSKGVRAHE